MTHDEMIAAIQAHKEGKPIEFRRSMPLTPWEELHALCVGWNFVKYEYRPKPEQPKPREWRVVISPDGRLCCSSRSLKEAAKNNAEFHFDRWPIVHVREVIE